MESWLVNALAQFEAQQQAVERELQAVMKLSVETARAEAAREASNASTVQNTFNAEREVARPQPAEEHEMVDSRTGEITCSICCEDKPAADFKGRLASGCTHLRTMCDLCVVQHIRAEVNGKGNTAQIRCPHASCGETLTHADIQKHASAADFEAYDKVLIKRSLQAMPEFRWCSRAGCGSGQLVEGADANPIMTCHHCRHRTCFKHRVAWHCGKTCEMYDADLGESEEAQLVQWMEEHAKRCPKCGVGIEKNEGCDHMTCKPCAGGCGAEFCWRCGADYNGPNGIRAVGNRAHHSSCMWHC